MWAYIHDRMHANMQAGPYVRMQACMEMHDIYICMYQYAYVHADAHKFAFIGHMPLFIDSAMSK